MATIRLFGFTRKNPVTHIIGTAEGWTKRLHGLLLSQKYLQPSVVVKTNLSILGLFDSTTLPSVRQILWGPVILNFIITLKVQ